MPTTIAGVALTHPDRVLFPDQGATKQDLAGYYAAVADWILPEIKDRPLTLVRCPQGRAGKCFYQKHWKATLPEEVGQVTVTGKSGESQYVLVRDLAGLIALVQIGVLEIHPWGARADRLDRPDRIVFDLDPGQGVTWPQVRAAGKEVRDLLEALGLASFVRTTGGSGVHLVLPIARRSDWEDVREFSQRVAELLVRREPRRFVANMRKSLRAGRIFVDYHRNRPDATAIASYSTRSRAGAPVATPVHWDELDQISSPQEFNLRSVPERIVTLSGDPWEELRTIRQSLTRSVWNCLSELESQAD